MKYEVEIDDGNGNISWVSVEADNENDADEAAKKMLLASNPDAEETMTVVISIIPQ